MLILLSMGIVAYRSVGELRDISGRVVQMMAKKDMASLIEASIEKQTTGIRGFLLAGDEGLLKHDEEGKEQFAENIEKLRKTIVTEEGKRLQAEIQRSYVEYRSIADRELELRRRGRAKEAQELAFDSHTTEIRSGLRTAISDLVDLEEHLKDKLLQEQADLARLHAKL